MRSAILGLLASGSAVYARGQWGDNYDGGGPGWGYYYGGTNDDGGGFGGDFGNGIGIDYGLASHYRTAHGVLAALAFVVIFPIGAIVMRLVPGRLSWIVHGVIQLTAYLVFVAGAALGIYLVSMVRIPPNNRNLLSIPQANAHPIIGLVILVVLFFQPALGWFHHLRYKRFGCRTGCSYAHIWVGRVAVTLGIINGGLGLGLARASQSAIVAYSVVAAFMWLLWVTAAIIGERRRRWIGVEPSTTAALNPIGSGPSPPYSPEPARLGRSRRRQRRHEDPAVEMGRLKRSHRDSSLSSVSSYSRRRI